MPVLAENKCFGATPYPINPSSLGLAPLWLPYPVAFAFFPMASQPLCRGPFVHAVAGWHRFGDTPLTYAAANGHTNAVKLLVRMGAAVNAQNTCNG